MIVFTGDWVKVSGQWKQVVAIDSRYDNFATLDSDGEHLWWGVEVPEVFEDHVSNTEMQAMLKEAGL